MKVVFKFLVSLVLALLLVWAIRTYAFTVFSVPPGGLPPRLKEGNRVIVNRIDCDKINRGETVVFADSIGQEVVDFIGIIDRLPGDTIRMGKNRYIIPTICCRRCGCKDCRYYLVNTAQGKMLVHKHQILGKAYKIF